MLKYTIELLRDLWNPTRLKTVGEKEYVRRLLAVVLPDFSGPKSERTEGRTQIYSLVRPAVFLRVHSSPFFFSSHPARSPGIQHCAPPRFNYWFFLKKKKNTLSFLTDVQRWSRAVRQRQQIYAKITCLACHTTLHRRRNAPCPHWRPVATPCRHLLLVVLVFLTIWYACFFFLHLKIIKKIRWQLHFSERG